MVLGAAPSIANGLITGVDYTPPLLLRAGRTMGLRGVALYRHLILPASLPAYVAGLKQGWAFAWRSLMAGELLVIIIGHPSLGDPAEHRPGQPGPAGAISIMIVILVIGIVVDTVFSKTDLAVRRRRGLLTDARAGLDRAGPASTRSPRVYTFIEPPRRKPTRVSPASAARSAASEDGAETAASTGEPGQHGLLHQLERGPAADQQDAAAQRQPALPQRPADDLVDRVVPPTSSRTASSSPSAPNTPAACSPPVLANTRWASRSASGSRGQPASRDARLVFVDVPGFSTKSSAVLAFPQTPHALVVMKFLRAAGATARPGRSSTSTMLPVPS